MTLAIIKGLLAVSVMDKSRNPEEILKEILQNQIKPILPKNSKEEVIKNQERWMMQQPKQSKRPKPPHDHSSHHYASRQNAGSRR